MEEADIPGFVDPKEELRNLSSIQFVMLLV